MSSTEEALSGRITTDLRPDEERWLRKHTPEGVSRQSFIRALFHEADGDDALLQRAREASKKDERLGASKAPQPGAVTDEEVRDAIEEHGSLSRASNALGIHRSSLRYRCARLEVFVPSMGRVPEQLEKYE